MNYDECVAWMGRYCAAKHAAPRLREKLAEETRRAEYAEVLRKAPAGTAETNLESAIASINARPVRPRRWRSRKPLARSRTRWSARSCRRGTSMDAPIVRSRHG